VVSAAYGKITALALDPIEKKPFDFFYPNTFILSIGSFGCNMHCRFCQNWEISTSAGDALIREFTPQELVEYALSLKERGNIGLAYTYNEPLINYEFVSDCAVSARRCGLKNVLVSNGFMDSALFAEFIPLMDAANIDFKSASSEFYKLHGGEIETVKANIITAARYVHLETTTLVIEGVNDKDEEIEEIALFLSKVDRAIPYHLTPFYPRYKMTNIPPTRLERLQELRLIAKKYLDNVV
jgi:pyruvate formate lyase activating enzyme